jgi:hypothetical protein
MKYGDSPKMSTDTPVIGFTEKEIAAKGESGG